MSQKERHVDLVARSWFCQFKSLARKSSYIAENPTWGAPRIHGELKMLGFDLSEPTVLRWMRKAPRNSDPAKRWVAFLKSHS